MLRQQKMNHLLHHSSRNFLFFHQFRRNLHFCSSILLIRKIRQAMFWVFIDTYVALWSLIELSTVIVLESKTWHASLTMIGSMGFVINVGEHMLKSLW